MTNRWDERRSGTFNAAAKGEVAKPTPAAPPAKTQAGAFDRPALVPKPPGGHAARSRRDQSTTQKGESGKEAEKGKPLSKTFNDRSR